VLLLAASSASAPAQGHVDLAVALLREHRGEISLAALEFGQPPRLLASVIFAERSSNVRSGKTFAEEVTAHCGFDSSLGIAQVKVSTAHWIEEHLRDLDFYGVVNDATMLRMGGGSRRGGLIARLNEPSTNLLYAAAYVALIRQAWAPVLQMQEMASRRAGLIATLYSLGLVRSDGSLRLPHPNPELNRFGEIAQGFYDGLLLREEFSSLPLGPQAAGE